MTPVNLWTSRLTLTEARLCLVYCWNTIWGLLSDKISAFYSPAQHWRYLSDNCWAIRRMWLTAFKLRVIQPNTSSSMYAANWIFFFFDYYFILHACLRLNTQDVPVRCIDGRPEILEIHLQPASLVNEELPCSFNEASELMVDEASSSSSFLGFLSSALLLMTQADSKQRHHALHKCPCTLVFPSESAEMCSSATQKEFFSSFFQPWLMCFSSSGWLQRLSVPLLAAVGLQGRLPRTHTQICESAVRFRCALWGETGVQPETVSLLGQREVIIPLTLSIVWRCVGGVTPALWGRCPPDLGQNRCCNSCHASSQVIC